MASRWHPCMGLNSVLLYGQGASSVLVGGISCSPALALGSAGLGADIGEELRSLTWGTQLEVCCAVRPCGHHMYRTVACGHCISCLLWGGTGVDRHSQS